MRHQLPVHGDRHLHLGVHRGVRHLAGAQPILRFLAHLAMLPLIVGISYEFNRWAGRHDGPITRILVAPGLWLQNFTTFEPDDSMMEVGIKALELVLPEKQGEDAW